MGYTTDFEGVFELSRPATLEEKDFLDKLAETRRMKRDVNRLMEKHKGAYGYPFAKDKTNPEEVYGYLGEYFIGGEECRGQGRQDDILDYNSASGERSWGKVALDEYPQSTKTMQPSLWLQWALNGDGTELQWDGGEKFYCFIEWLEYLIEHFFEPWGIKLNGKVDWFGEDANDRGKIEVKDNKISIYEARITYTKIR